MDVDVEARLVREKSNRARLLATAAVAAWKVHWWLPSASRADTWSVVAVKDRAMSCSS